MPGEHSPGIALVTPVVGTTGDKDGRRCPRRLWGVCASIPALSEHECYAKDPNGFSPETVLRLSEEQHKTRNSRRQGQGTQQTKAGDEPRRKSTHCQVRGFGPEIRAQSV